jgi:hypothetical protein
MAHLTAEVHGAPASEANPDALGSTDGAAHGTPTVGFLAATWAIYVGGATVAAMMTVFLASVLVLALPIALLVVVILTAASYFRRQAR